MILGFPNTDSAEPARAQTSDANPKAGSAKSGKIHRALSVLIGGDTIRDNVAMRQVEVIGHRGARGLFPENTIEGFRHALKLGVRSFELDVGMTEDGVVVVSHDLALNPNITRDAA